MPAGLMCPRMSGRSRKKRSRTVRSRPKSAVAAGGGVARVPSAGQRMRRLFKPFDDMVSGAMSRSLERASTAPECFALSWPSSLGRSIRSRLRFSCCGTGTGSSQQSPSASCTSCL